MVGRGWEEDDRKWQGREMYAERSVEGIWWWYSNPAAGTAAALGCAAAVAAAEAAVGLLP